VKILKNIMKNKYIYIFLVAILSVVLILSSFMYKNISMVNKKNNYINSYFNIPDVYMMTLTWTMEDNPYVTKLDKKFEDGGVYVFHAQLFNEADKKGIDQFGVLRDGMYAPYGIEIKEIFGDKNFNQTLPQQPELAEYPNLGIFINDLFGENIKFPLDEGRNFSLNDFNETEFLPIIAGYTYKEKFKIGDTLNIKVLKYYTEKEDKTVQGKIIGFLDKDAEVTTSTGVEEIINANKLIIIGLSNEYKYDAGFFGVFRETLNGVVETKNPQEVEEKIMDFARKMGYEGKGSIIKLVDMKDAYKDYVEFNESSYSSYYKIFGISIFASLVITILSIYLIIRKNKFDYGVLLINGATKNKIRNSILLENLIILLLADVIGIILTLKYIGTLSPLVFIGYNLVMLVIVLLTSSLILKNKKTIEFINFNEQNN